MPGSSPALHRVPAISPPIGEELRRLPHTPSSSASRPELAAEGRSVLIAEETAMSMERPYGGQASK